MCEYLLVHPETALGRSVIELGAGTGIAGILAAMLGMYIKIVVTISMLDHW